MPVAIEREIARQRTAAPIARLLVQQPSGPAPFVASFSTDGTGTGVPLEAWRLDFGDGTIGLSGTGPLPGTADHVYRRPGTYTARLWIRAVDQATARAEVQIQVDARPPRPTDDDGTLVPLAGGRDDGKKLLVAAGLLLIFDRFISDRRPGQRQRIEAVVLQAEPTLPLEQREEVVTAELDAERAYATKARKRMQRDLPGALSVPDPEERDAAVMRLLEREKRYLVAREAAIAERAAGRAASALLKLVSPNGARWVLHPHLDHCVFCTQMDGKIWGWDVLAVIRPPVHPNCRCTLQPAPPGVAPLGFADAPQLQLLECACEHPTVQEAPYARRWAAGTERAGEFRPLRGGSAGARIPRRGVRAALPREPAPGLPRRAPRRIVDEQHVRDLDVADLRPGDQVIVDGDLARVRSVDPDRPGVVLLDTDDAVQIQRDRIRGVPGPEHPTVVPATITASDERRIRAAAVADAVQRADVAALSAVIAGQSAQDAAALLDTHGLELRRSARPERGRTAHTLRGPRAETVTVAGPDGGTFDLIQIAGNPQRGRRDRLPPGRAPADADEMFVDALGRADELGERFDAAVNVTGIVQGGVAAGALAHHEWNGTIALRPSKETRRMNGYLRAHAAGGPIDDATHLQFYDDVRTLQHEIAHGVAAPGRELGGLSIGPRHYRGDGRLVEEALTEESAHLLAAEWIAGYGMPDALSAVARHPDDPRVAGAYTAWRTSLRRIVDRADLDEQGRRDLLLRLKFQSTPEDRERELAGLAGTETLSDALALDGPPGPFRPVARPDLSGVDATPRTDLPSGRRVGIGAMVTVDDPDLGAMQVMVEAIRPGAVLVRVDADTTRWVSTGALA